MRALTKLIKVNEPDLVLFVGEALVGNEAVDQLVKFNQALADYSYSTNASPHLIDGIVLTKFDTIDDKVSGETRGCLACNRLFCLGWRGHFDDLHYRTADSFRWHRPDLHGFEGVKRQSRSACANEVTLYYIYIKVFNCFILFCVFLQDLGGNK